MVATVIVLRIQWGAFAQIRSQAAFFKVLEKIFCGKIFSAFLTLV